MAGMRRRRCHAVPSVATGRTEPPATTSTSGARSSTVPRATRIPAPAAIAMHATSPSTSGRGDGAPGRRPRAPERARTVSSGYRHGTHRPRRLVSATSPAPSASSTQIGPGPPGAAPSVEVRVHPGRRSGGRRDGASGRGAPEPSDGDDEQRRADIVRGVLDVRADEGEPAAVGRRRRGFDEPARAGRPRSVPPACPRPGRDGPTDGGTGPLPRGARRRTRAIDRPGPRPERARRSRRSSAAGSCRPVARASRTGASVAPRTPSSSARQPPAVIRRAVGDAPCRGDSTRNRAGPAGAQNAISFPSGDHAKPWMPWRASVTRRGSPPSSGSTHTWVTGSVVAAGSGRAPPPGRRAPSRRVRAGIGARSSRCRGSSSRTLPSRRADRNARRVPSGENRGCVSLGSPEVSWRARPRPSGLRDWRAWPRPGGSSWRARPRPSGTSHNARRYSIPATVRGRRRPSRRRVRRRALRGRPGGGRRPG